MNIITIYDKLFRKRKYILDMLEGVRQEIDTLFDTIDRMPEFQLIIKEPENPSTDTEFLLESDLFRGYLNYRHKTLYLTFLIYSGKDAMTNTTIAQSSISMFSAIGNIFGAWFPQFETSIISTFLEADNNQESSILLSQILYFLKSHLNDDELFYTISTKITGQYGVA